MKIIIICLLFINCSSSSTGRVARLENPKTSDQNDDSCFNSDLFIMFRQNISNSKLQYIYINLNQENLFFWDLIQFYKDDELLEKNSFTADDFEKNSKYIFTSDFINGLNALNVSDLFENGKSESALMTNEIEAKFYSIKAIYDEKKKELLFLLYYEFLDDGETYETTINYYFEFENCEILLRDIIIVN
jgi:hypothetical protein